jgi:hypothetical protein
MPEQLYRYHTVHHRALKYRKFTTAFIYCRTGTVLRDVYGIYESSYRIMGDNLGGGEQRTTDC